MGIEKFGTDAVELNTGTGGIVSADGATLLDTGSSGETAIMFGPAANRAIQAGIENGAWSALPPDPDATITSDNPLPYWSFTDTSSAGAITCAIASDTGSASGNALRFTIANSTGSGLSAQVSRFFPIPSSRSRALWQGIEVSFAPNYTLSNNARFSAQVDFYANDQTTQVYANLGTTPSLAARAATTATITTAAAHNIVTGDTITLTLSSGPTGYAALNGTWVVTATPSTTSFTFTTVTSGTITSGAAVGTITVSTKTGSIYSSLPAAFIDNSMQIPDPSVGGSRSRAATPPATAAYARAVITIDTIGVVTPAATLDISEVRAVRGVQELVLNDALDPVTYAPSYIKSTNGALYLAAPVDPSRQNAYIVLQNSAVAAVATINAKNTWLGDTGVGDGNLKVETISAESTTTSDLLLQATGSDVVVQDTNVTNGTNPRIFMRDKNGTTYAGIKSGAAGVLQILSGTSTTTYGQLWAARIYPMNGSTASRYIDDDGTNIRFSAGLTIGGGTTTTTGIFKSTGSGYENDQPTTTTATTNAAIWVLISGTNYSLRRNSSSARYKTDITDADAAVLEAAKRVKARHYTSTIAEESGATRLGFIAEEVYDAGLTHAVGYDAEGRPETLDTTALIAALFVRIEELENRLAKLERA